MGFPKKVSAQTDITWKAKWVKQYLELDLGKRPCQIFRKAFKTYKDIYSAKLYLTAHGLFEIRINNMKVSNGYFTPGFTSYHQRLQYQVYDISRLLRKGSNKITVTLGDGWWRGVFGGDMQNNHYGKDASILAQLEIHYVDGTKKTINTDSTWRCATGPVRYADFYNGEIYDARVLPVNWTKVVEVNYVKTNLVRTIGELVTKHEIFAPLKIFTTPNGEQVSVAVTTAALFLALK